jgi:hypothetical protein
MKKIKREGVEDGGLCDIESSDEELERRKVCLERSMVVKIEGELYYMRDVGDSKNILFRYPEGRIIGQYIKESRTVRAIDFEY